MINMPLKSPTQDSQSRKKKLIQSYVIKISQFRFYNIKTLDVLN